MPIRKKFYSKEEALAKMESLCSRSEQCESDIITKLINLNIPESQCLEIIRELKENRYLDNARFARSFVSDKARFSHWGPYKIKKALVRKRISVSIITEALQSIDEEIWRESLMKIAKSKARTLDLTVQGEDGYENRKKLFTFLIGRGFSGKDANIAVKLMKNTQELQA